MLHNTNDAIIMWQETDKRKRIKGVHVTKFNVKKPIKIHHGDRVFIGKNQLDQSMFWEVEDVIETRQSTLKYYDYVTTKCSFITN